MGAVRAARTRTVVITGVAGVLAGVLALALVLALLSSGRVKSRLGDPVFDAGDAEQRARQAREEPILLPALVGFDLDVRLSHLGGREWRAFRNHAPGKSRRCALRYRRATRDFVDCDGAVYPLDGTGLPQYSASVDQRGRLIVDLRTEVTTTAAPRGAEREG
jgi:hypothetical protein